MATVIGTVGANYPALSIGYNVSPTPQPNVTRIAQGSVFALLVGWSVVPTPQFNVSGIKTGGASTGGTVGYANG